MIFLSVQHVSIYYLWQVQVMVFNLKSKGIRKEEIHILLATFKQQKIVFAEQRLLQYIKNNATSFFYEDTREIKAYPSSIRPHILAKHFALYPNLERERIFYHDCDIIFRELPPLFKSAPSQVWFVSDTSHYLGSHYIKSQIGAENFRAMCAIVGVNENDVCTQDANCGGAQYLLQNVATEFWLKVEKDSECLYTFLRQLNTEKHIDQVFSNYQYVTFDGIQSWCADMWSILWNALYFKYKVQTHSSLNFCWPKESIVCWQKNYILHNAGIGPKDAELYLYKGRYTNCTPFHESFGYVDKNACTDIYVNAVTRVTKEVLKERIPLKDFSFLIPVIIDSDDRLDNIYTIVRYLQKHFITNISILEYGKIPKINKEKFIDKIDLTFVRGEKSIFNHAACNNKLILPAKTPFFAIYDADVIMPVRQILEAAKMLRSNQTSLVCPYDGTVISVDKLAATIFSRLLDTNFLEENKEKFIVSSRGSFEGCTMLNRTDFLKLEIDNKKIFSREPEDIFRYLHLKILGYKTLRIKGSIYHMYHQR